MKELFYYSIFAIVLYFVFSSVFENFNLEQENFDPSLVPVSSIVTLAKVAQKLVNGNGTLTNPGNLQIGTSTSAPGNLTVTGNTTVSGNVNARNGTAYNTRIGQIWTTAGIYAESGTTGLELGAANKNVYIGAANNIDNQNLTVTGDLNVNGVIGAQKLKSATWHTSSDGQGRVNYNGATYFSSNSGFHFRPLAGASGDGVINRMMLDTNGNLNVTGEVSGLGHTFYDRNTPNNRFEWYASGGTARLYYNAVNPANKPDGAKHNTNIFNIDYFGNANVTGTLGVNSGMTTGYNINARSSVESNKYNTRVGGIWTTAGVYAETGTAGLELGATNKNVYIGPANNSEQHNLTVTGNLTTVGDVNPYLFYTCGFSNWTSPWQGNWYDTTNGIERAFAACNAIGGGTCTWDRLSGEGNAYDPHGGQGKTLTVNYKCGLKGIRKSKNFGDGDTVTVTCP